MLSQPENGFESVIKDADSLRRLFFLLVKPYCLEVVAALYAKKPNENVTGRLLAKELNAPEPEVIAVLDELCKYHLIRNLEITDKSLVQEGYSIIAGDKQQSYTMAGYPIGYFYGYKVAGVYQSQADIDASPKNTLATVTPGDLKFADVNGDGEITPEDRTMIGNPTPKVTYGFSLGVNYKNWSLGIDMMGQGGNQIFRTWDNYNFAQFNYLEQRMDRWHGEGTSNSQPLLNTKHSINNLNSEYYIEDGKFFRIRNVQLAYAFDKSLLAKIRLQALKVYVNIQNLKTWKHNTGYTPELGGTATAFGVDDGSYPVPAVYTFGINLTF